MKEKEKGIRVLFIPFSVNLIFSCTVFYVSLLMAIAILHNITIDIALILLLLMPVLFQTIINILLYFLYYKKKNKLTKKEYFLTCLSGATAVIIYLFWLKVKTMF
jgi:hypothetical protein